MFGLQMPPIAKQLNKLDVFLRQSFLWKYLRDVGSFLQAVGGTTVSEATH